MRDGEQSGSGDPPRTSPDSGHENANDAGLDRRVLVVEDDAFLRQLLRVTLRRSGYEVIEATDGAHAWDMLQKQPVPMVLTDWMMPGMDGPELVQRIRDAGWPGY